MAYWRPLESDTMTTPRAMPLLLAVAVRAAVVATVAIIQDHVGVGPLRLKGTPLGVRTLRRLTESTISLDQLALVILQATSSNDAPGQ